MNWPEMCSWYELPLVPCCGRDHDAKISEAKAAIEEWQFPTEKGLEPIPIFVVDKPEMVNGSWVSTVRSNPDILERFKERKSITTEILCYCPLVEKP